MASERLVTEQFQFLGIEVQDEVLAKCKYLSPKHIWVFYLYSLINLPELSTNFVRNLCFKVVSLLNLLLFKGVSLCDEYSIDAESLTEQWMAFSLNHLNGAAPTLENLDVFARKEFSKRPANYLNAPSKEAARSSTGSSLMVYGAPVPAQYPFIRMFHVFHCFLTASRVFLSTGLQLLPKKSPLLSNDFCACFYDNYY